MIRTRIKNLEDTMETLVHTPNSSVKSSTTDSFYIPGCRRDTNCKCEICIASINATLDLMPQSVGRTSLTKLSITRRKIQRSPVSFPLSPEYPTPKFSRRIRPVTASPPQKSTAGINFEEKVKREKGELGYRVFLVRFILGLILVCGVEYGFHWMFSGAMKGRLSPKIVKNLAEKSWIDETLSGRHLLLKNGLEELVGNQVSSCRSDDSVWKISQDGSLLNSRCVLYESMIEQVSIWGWPLQTAGLLTAEFSSRSFSIISGRVTEWSIGEANYSVRMANSSWEQEKWSSSVLQLDPNTWILEYRQSFLFENSKPISAALMFLKCRLTIEIEKFKQEFCRKSRGVDFVGGKKIVKSYFDVLGVCCSSEVPLIEDVVNSLDGIKDFSIIIPTRTLIVFHDPLLISRIHIVEALNRARLEAAIREDGTTSLEHKWPTPYALASGTLLMLSFLDYFYAPRRWLAVAAAVVGSPPIILKAFAALGHLYLDVNILVLIAVGGSIGLGDYWEAGTIVFLFTISTWLESRASHEAAAAMSSLVRVVPQKAVVAETGEEIDADEVKLNTILAVKAGQVIPIDGVVVQGTCEVDEKILTGESFPVTKQKDSSVWASTINLNGYISIRTTAVAGDSVVARMAKIVEEAQGEKSRAQRLIDKCARYYTPTIVAISACLALVPIAFRIDHKKQWYHLALVVLVNGCPCALVLSTPVAMFCALSKAATLGVLFKGAQHLETLAGIKAMAFDKTGTITRGEFLMEEFEQLRDDVSLNTLLFWISSIECKSSHPMAAALVDFARGRGVEPKPDLVENYQNFPGEGISGKIDDNELYIGNWRIASRAGCSVVPKPEGYNDMEGKSIGYVFLASSPAAVFSLSDVCRTGAKDSIQDLNSMGIKTVMLTGDCHGAAKHAQDQLGGAFDNVYAELLPEDKTKVIKELQRAGPTAMIGDGLNDAPALATADIGISMGLSGSALATESGDVVLMSNDVLRIAKMLRLAKSVRRKLIENVVFSISIKVAILCVAIAGYPIVWVAVLSDVGTCLLVIFNSMLLLRDEAGQGEKCYQSENKYKLIESEKCISECGGNTRVEPDEESQVPRKQCCPDSSLEPRGENGKCSSSARERGDRKGRKCCSVVVGNDSGTTLDHNASEERGGVVSMPGCKASTECSKGCTKQHGCCASDSFRRECCNGDGDSGTSFRGGLSEIVIQ